MKKTNFTFSHPRMGVEKAIKPLSFVVSFLAFFFVLGIQGISAQTPSELGEELTEDVKHAFTDEITSLEMDYKNGGHSDDFLLSLAKYLDEVRNDFDDGAGLGEAFRGHANGVFGAVDKDFNSPSSGFLNSNATSEEVREFTQMTQDIQLSEGDLEDLTDIFQFLRTL